MSLPKGAVPICRDESKFCEWYEDTATHFALPRSDFDAQEARIAAVLAEVDAIDERLRLDGSSLCLSEIGPLLDAARAMRRTT